MQELRSGLWTWTAPHPDWTPEQGGPDGWGPDVRSYAYDGGDSIVLFDPVAPPTHLLENLVEAKDVAVLQTCSWHARATQVCVDEYGAHVFVGAESTELPAGIETRPGAYDEEVLFWLPRHGALVAGDALLGEPNGIRVQPDAWLGAGRTREGLRDTLRPLLDLPVELLLPTHGDPVVEHAHESLRAALDV